MYAFLKIELDSKFEDLDHIKRNSDSFRNRWETFKYSSATKS